MVVSPHPNESGIHSFQPGYTFSKKLRHIQENLVKNSNGEIEKLSPLLNLHKSRYPIETAITS